MVPGLEKLSLHCKNSTPAHEIQLRVIREVAFPIMLRKKTAVIGISAYRITFNPESSGSLHPESSSSFPLSVLPPLVSGPDIFNNWEPETRNWKLDHIQPVIPSRANAQLHLITIKNILMTTAWTSFPRLQAFTLGEFMVVFDPAASAYEKFLRTGNLSYFYTMDTFDMVIVGIYFGILAILSFYGLHRYMMVFLYHKHHKKGRRPVSQFRRIAAGHHTASGLQRNVCHGADHRCGLRVRLSAR